jgi:hypothetical protein
VNPKEPIDDPLHKVPSIMKISKDRTTIAYSKSGSIVILHDYNTGLAMLNFKEKEWKEYRERLKTLDIKQEFETTDEYNARFNKEIMSLKKYISEIYTKQLQQRQFLKDNSLEEIQFPIQDLGRYNADKKCYPITVKDKYYYLPMPIEDAKDFKESWKTAVVKGFRKLKDNLDTYDYFNLRITHPLSKTVYQFGKQIPISDSMLIIAKENIPTPNAYSWDWIDSLSKGINNSNEVYKLVEKKQLKVYAEYVKRSGKDLILSLANGKKKIYTTKNIEGDAGVWYTFIEYMKEYGYYLIARSYYEGGDYIMINEKTGKETAINSLPIVSPDKSRFAIATMGGEAGYIPDEIQVYRFSDTDIIVEYKCDKMDWGPSDIQWIGNNKLKVLKNVTDESGTYGVIPPIPVKLVRSANKWVLYE